MYPFSQNRCARGMTLLEAGIAAAIFALIIAMSFSVLHFSTRSFNEEVQLTHLQMKGEEALRAILDLVNDSETVKIYQVPRNSNDPHYADYNGYIFNGAELEFQVPVSNPLEQNLPIFNVPLKNRNPGTPGYDPNYTGSNPTFLGDFGMDLIYGWRDDARMVIDLRTGKKVPFQGPCVQADQVPVSQIMLADTRAPLGPNGVDGTTPVIPRSTPNGFMYIRFVMNKNSNLGQNGIFNEAVEQVDIDNDGALNSVYAVGFLERSYYVCNVRDSSGLCDLRQRTYVPESAQIMADSNILQPLPSPMGRVPQEGCSTLETAQSMEDAAKLKTNRIFVNEYDGTTQLPIIDINLYVLSMGEARIPRVVRCSSLNFLRNKPTGP